LRSIFAAGDLKLALNINVLPRPLRDRVDHNVSRAAFHCARADEFFAANPLWGGSGNLAGACANTEEEQARQAGDTKTGYQHSVREDHKNAAELMPWGSKGAEIISKFQHNANGIVARNYFQMACIFAFSNDCVMRTRSDAIATAVFTETTNPHLRPLFGLVGVAVKDPGIVDSRIEPYVNRAPVGWNIIYCD
jgi:hypothetical protein